MENLTISSISKSYYGKKAVDSVSFSIGAGRVVGLLGPNGAGKTTTMNIITGVLAPDEGEVLFDGKKMSHEHEQGLKSKIGYLAEVNALYPDMLVSEYLDFMAALRGLDKMKRKEAISRVVEQTGIKDKLNQPIEELSKGYKQRVGLAQAILHEPEILILDEPTEGLDPNQRVTIRDLISRLGKDRTVMISTHVLSEVQAVCDEVVILNQGKVVSKGSVQDIVQEQQRGQKVVLEVRGEGVEEAIRTLGAEILDKRGIQDRWEFTLLGTGEDLRPRLFELSKQRGWTLYELHQEQTSLEDIFRSLTVEEKA